MNGVDLTPPVERGSFLGLKPQDWLATLGGLLGGARLGNTGIRPFQALFPLAAGLERRDEDTRLRYTVDQLRKVYGNESGPEFQGAMALLNSGRVAEAVAMMSKGIAERNALRREEDKRRYETEGEIAAGEAMRPVTEPGIVSFERMAPPRPGAALSPDVNALLTPMDATDYRDFQDVDRAPTPGEIIARLAQQENPEVRGMAHKAVRPFLTAQALKDAELRPKTEVKEGAFIRQDPRRGTASFAGHVPLSPLKREEREALIAQRRANAREKAALTAKHERPPTPTPGSPERPHIWHDRMDDPETGKRTLYEFRSFSKANPDAPNGVEQVTQMRRMGTSSWKPFAPSADAGGVKESQTTVSGTHPEREIYGLDALTALKGELPQLTAELTQGLTPPADPAQLKEYYKDLEQAVKARFKQRGLGVELRFTPGTNWLGKPTGTGEFSLIRAWKLPSPYSRTSRTLRGPQGTLPAPPPDTGDPDDGDDDE